MKAHCIICDNDIDLPVEELIMIEEEIDDYVCDDCANICIKEAPAWWWEIQSHIN